MDLLHKIIRLYHLYAKQGIIESDLLTKVIYELYDYLLTISDRLSLSSVEAEDRDSITTKKYLQSAKENFQLALSHLNSAKYAKTENRKMLLLDSVTHLIHQTWMVKGEFFKFRYELRQRHWNQKNGKGGPK